MRGRRPASPVPVPGLGLHATVLAGVALLGLGTIVQPFTWDQAVFALGAERILAGARLYADYWDFKQPGIFWFFAAAGRVFGMHEAGVHLGEFVWMLALAIVLQRCARGWLGSVGAACTPLVVCGFYDTVAGAWQLLQVEGLVLLPLTLSFMAAWRARRGGSRLAWIAAGAAGGWVRVFKLVLAPVLAAIWIVPVWDSIRRAARPLAETASVLVPLAVGAAMPLALTVALFAIHGDLALVWWTWVVYPAQVLARLRGLPVRNLEATGHWLLAWWLPLLLPAALGAWNVARDRADAFGRSLLAWLGAGIVVILLQRWSGWQYQVFLVLVPLGLLATRGLESIAEAIARRSMPARARTALALALGAAIAGVFLPALRRTGEVILTGALVDPAARRRLLAERSGGAYDFFTRATGFLQSPTAEAGPIYVLGNPLAYWISGRHPAIAWPGGMSIYSAREWALIARALEEARPPYILLEDPMRSELAGQGAAARPLVDVLQRNYRPGSRFGPDQWLVRRGP